VRLPVSPHPYKELSQFEVITSDWLFHYQKTKSILPQYLAKFKWNVYQIDIHSKLFIANVYQSVIQSDIMPEQNENTGNELRTNNVLLRLKLTEKQAFQDAAELAGVPLSAWMRERLRQAAIKELEAQARPIAFLNNRID
jgi:hypothetical protein